jgi:hypothetical protein
MHGQMVCDISGTMPDAPVFLMPQGSGGFVLPVFKENVGLMHLTTSHTEGGCQESYGLPREPQTEQHWLLSKYLQ